MGDGDVYTAFLASSTIMRTLVRGAVTAVGPTASSNVGIGGTLVYGPHSASMAFTCPATGCDNFGIQLAFTGADGGDRVIPPTNWHRRRAYRPDTADADRFQGLPGDRGRGALSLDNGLRSGQAQPKGCRRGSATNASNEALLLVADPIEP